VRKREAQPRKASVAQQIKVILKRVLVKNDATGLARRVLFHRDVDGRSVGDRTHIFDAREGQWINLPAAMWSAVVDVAGKAQVVVQFKGKDDDVFVDDDLGHLTYTLRPPWAERTFVHNTEFFALEWTVELLVDGRFGHHPPNEVFTCRASAGTAACTTVSGIPSSRASKLIPFARCPGLPPRGLPAGPVLASTTAAGRRSRPARTSTLYRNPSVIPILTAPGGAAPAAGAPPVADATNAPASKSPSTVEHARLRPNDPRLEWTARPVAGAPVDFIGPPRASMSWFTALPQARWPWSCGSRRADGDLSRAGDEGQEDPCRCNILNGPNATSRPRATLRTSRIT